MSDTPTLAERFVAFREAHDLSQRELASLFLAAQGTITHVEREVHHSPAWERIMDFAEVYPDILFEILTNVPINDPIPWTQRIQTMQEALGLSVDEMRRLFDVTGVTMENWVSGIHPPNARYQVLYWLFNAYVDVPMDHWPRSLYSLMGARDVMTPERVKALRHKYYWTQREMAYLVGTYGGSVSRWERGATAPQWCYNTLLRVLEKFGGPAISLFERVPHINLTYEVTGDLLREVRERLSYTSGVFADLLGVDPSTLSALENTREYGKPGPDEFLCLRLMYFLLDQEAEDFIPMLENLGIS